LVAEIVAVSIVVVIVVAIVVAIVVVVVAEQNTAFIDAILAFLVVAMLVRIGVGLF
jgi:hypothetical protein